MALRKFTNSLMVALCYTGAFLALSVLGLVLFFLAARGLHSLHWTLFTRLPNHEDEKLGGMAQSVAGTLTLLGVASVIGLPIGVLGGIYQVESRGRFASTVRFFTDVLNGIPSIVIGIFVYAIWVYPIAQHARAMGQPASGYSAYAGGFALSIMMIPTIMRTTEEILRLVPNAMREASLALGATRWRTMWSVVLPAAKGGIITGIMLALARIAGETAPLLFTIFGNEIFATHVARVGVKHQGHFSGVLIHKVPTLSGAIDALPLRIYKYSQDADLNRNAQAWAASVVLITLILVLSIAARFATRGNVMEEK